MQNKTYCVNKIHLMNLRHRCTTSPSMVHFEKKYKIKSGFFQKITVIVWTIPNLTQQHKAELHLYLSNTSY